ncbi:hypothetical protein Hanom_Chr02g00155281 [Helianthus anomalus]
MDPIPNSVVWKDQACEIEASKASFDESEKSVDIICYGSMFSPYMFDLRCKFSEEVILMFI